MDINKIIVGGIYFELMYEDENLSIPVIKTLIFEKFAVRSGGARCLIFKEISDHDVPKFYIDEGLVDSLLFDLDGLVAELQSVQKKNGLSKSD